MISSLSNGSMNAKVENSGNLTNICQDIQDSDSPLNKDHQILPVSILVYIEYADLENEFVNTMQAIDNSYGTDYYYENLTDYTELNSKLPGHDILLIVEQEFSVSADMIAVGNAWATTLTNFITNGGIVIMLDNDDETFHIGNESGLFTFSATTSYLSTGTAWLVNNNDALARGVSSSWTFPSHTVCSFDTTETKFVVTDGTDPVIFHKIIGSGHLIVMGCDFTYIESNFETILGNAIRLHRHVIFDDSHSQSETIFNGFEDYANDLISQGFAVSNMNFFNPTLINSGDVLIITRASTDYTNDEIDTIETFVSNGGGLFIATDSTTGGVELDPIINRFGFIRNESFALKDTNDFLNGNPINIEYDDITNHSLSISTIKIEFYGSTGLTTVPSCADIILATDTDGTSQWADGSPADGVPLVATDITEGNGRIVVFSDNSFMYSHTDSDTDGTNNYNDEDNEILLLNTVNWLSAAGVEECVVLFEESYDPWYNINGGYNITGQYLTSIGYTVKWMYPFNASLIDSADILVIAGGKDDYTLSNISIITNFVSNGGGLFLLGDIKTYTTNIIPIAHVFGIDFNTTAAYLIDPGDELGGINYNIYYEESNFGTHSIMQGISRIELYGSSGLTINSGGTQLIVTDTDGTCSWNTGSIANGVSVMSATKYNLGRVVVSTDFSILLNIDKDGDGSINLFDSDNDIFTTNTFQWLSEAGETSTTTGGGSGGNGGSDDAKDEGITLLMLMIILGAIIGIIALVAIVLLIKKKR
ncbi:MAG: hypothetical protein ACFFDK_04900 [Promethearchaeota archaeon]